MKAFYAPELTSNALRVSGPGCDPSTVVNQLLMAAARAQTVCGTDVAGRPILTYFPPPVLSIPVGMVSGTAADQVSHSLLAYLFLGTERLSGRFPSCPLSGFPKK